MPITGAPPAVGGAGLYDAYVCVRDVKAQNTGGGTFAAGVWRTRDINEEQADASNICVIATNQLTLAAGTYRCSISCPGRLVTSHQARLYNVTDSALLVLGHTAFNSSYTNDLAWIRGRFTVGAAKAIEVQHYGEVTRNNDGFGEQGDITDEIYTVAEFWREA